VQEDVTMNVVGQEIECNTTRKLDLAKAYLTLSVELVFVAFSYARAQLNQRKRVCLSVCPSVTRLN